MGQRIRYGKTESPNEVISTRTYKVMDGKEVRVVLNTLSKKYEIVDATTWQVYEEASSVSLHKLKIAAKKALEGLGATFEDEMRTKNESAPESVTSEQGTN